MQLCRSYGVNKRASNPVHFILTSVSDKAKEALQRMSVSNWKNVYLFDKHWSLLSQKDLSSIGIHSVVDSIDPTSASLDGSYIRREQFVYLTGDAPETLQTFIPSRFYIIGGIVDKNRHKNLTFLESQKYGILAQKLPIKEESGNIQLQSSTIFTCNQIFELILSFLEKQNWRDALQECIPKRKIVLNS